MKIKLLTAALVSMVAFNASAADLKGHYRVVATVDGCAKDSWFGFEEVGNSVQWRSNRDVDFPEGFSSPGDFGDSFAMTIREELEDYVVADFSFKRKIVGGFSEVKNPNNDGPELVKLPLATAFEITSPPVKLDLKEKTVFGEEGCKISLMINNRTAKGSKGYLVIRM